jgi:calcineurin-like phosphoesterase
MQVERGRDLVQSKVGNMLAEREVSYTVHVLKHTTNTTGVASAIANKAKELNAHSITMTHHKHNVLAVSSPAISCENGF